MHPRNCSLLISTYNWPQALELVLKSALSQTQPPTEILIADDGSREETRLLIEQFQRESAIPIRHSWHEDAGFRKAKILNKTLAVSASEYIIQIDGDCIVHPKFVEDHMNAAEQGVYLYGSRVNILPDSVADILANGQIKFGFWSSRIKNKTRNLHIPFLSRLYQASAGFSGKFRGCNVSFWREDFMTVNGYNEDYEGWGREDSDLVIRMGNSGITAKRLRYAGILYHIHHKMNSRDNFGLNDLIQREAIEKKVVWIARGVDQYLSGNLG
jgi:glycosyltransferase involved in cell wall biosynthesis